MKAKQYLVSFTKHNKLQFNHLFVWPFILYLFCSVILLNKQLVKCGDDYSISPGQDDSEIRESEALIKNEQIQSSLKKFGENLVEKLGDSVKNALAPPINYFNLVNRYHVWLRGYKKLEKLSNGSMRSATEVLKEEYAKVDRILYEEECSSDPKDISDDKRATNYSDKLESVDFVFNVLRKVIDRLEQSLAKMKSEQGLKVKRPENLGLKLLLSDFPIQKDDSGGEESNAEEEDRASTGQQVDDEQVRVAMERVKGAVLKAATSVVANEAMVVANLALVSRAFNSMSSLSYLAPIVTLLGSANTPLTVWYLRNLELRAALAVINRVNPLSFLNCNLRNQKGIDQNQKLTHVDK